MEKTIIEWYDEIEDEGVKAEAVCNAIVDGSENKIQTSLLTALINGFDWDATLQGYHFWNSKWNDLFNKEKDNA